MGLVIETDEQGRLVLPSEILSILGEAHPHTKYRVETVGTRIIVDSAPPSEELSEKKELFTQQKLTPEEWMQQWHELSERIGRVWNTDKSAAEIISDMRR